METLHKREPEQSDLRRSAFLLQFQFLALERVRVSPLRSSTALDGTLSTPKKNHSRSGSVVHSPWPPFCIRASETKRTRTLESTTHTHTAAVL